MATKAELLEKARNSGLDVKTKATKAELESMLGADDNGNAEGTTTNEVAADPVEVNPNEGGEATNGTTEDGNEEPVKNTDSVPQNGATTVNVLDDADSEGFGSTVEDESRKPEEVTFADESNPNQKARRTGDGGSDFDQDGNPRTGGKSYGVAADDPDTEPQIFSANNAGEAPEGRDLVPLGSYLNPEAGSEDDTNSQEWDQEKQKSLEDSLSEPDQNILARVTTSVGNYVRVKFYRNNLPFGTYRSRDFTEEKAAKYLSDLKESAGL